MTRESKYPFKCVVCGKEYFAKTNSKRNKYCSYECSMKGAMQKREKDIELAQKEYPIIQDSELAIALGNKEYLNDAMKSVEFLERVIGDFANSKSLAEIKHIIQNCMSKIAEIDNEDNVGDFYSEDVRKYIQTFIQRALLEIIDNIYIEPHVCNNGYGAIRYLNINEKFQDCSYVSNECSEYALITSYKISSNRNRCGCFFMMNNNTIIHDLEYGCCHNKDCKFCVDVHSKYHSSRVRESYCLLKLPYANVSTDSKESVESILSAKRVWDWQDALNACQYHKQMIDVSRGFACISLMLQRALNRFKIDKYIKKSLYELYLNNKRTLSAYPSGVYRKIREVCICSIQRQFLEENNNLYILQKNFADKYRNLFKTKF